MIDRSEEVRERVRSRYAGLAETADRSPSGCDTGSNCCGTGDPKAAPEEIARALGYDPSELADLPEGANLGLGCGNPHSLAGLRSGETVVDLGSGAGIDCFLAARKVGPEGRVIGVDMTPQMVSKARRNAREHGFENVEFRLGEIEHLPLADACADVILSNCVVNLSPDKPAVLREAFRVLKPGGRVAISDIVATADMSAELLEDGDLLCGCISGAAKIEALEAWLAEAGFEEISIRTWEESRSFIKDWAPGTGVERYVVSASIEARKPAP